MLSKYNFIVISIYCILFLVTSFAQHTVDINQEYSYDDDTLEVNIKSNKYTVSSTDSISLEFSIKNVSNHNIFIFDKPYIKYNLSKNLNCSELFFEYGSNYEKDMIIFDSMYVLKPKLKMVFKYIIDVNTLTKNGFKNYINIVLGLGFIKNINDIKPFIKYEKYHSFIINDYLYIDVLTLQAILSRKNFNAFSIKIE